MLAIRAMLQILILEELEPPDNGTLKVIIFITLFLIFKAFLIPLLLHTNLLILSIKETFFICTSNFIILFLEIKKCTIKWKILKAQISTHLSHFGFDLKLALFLFQWLSLNVEMRTMEVIYKLASKLRHEVYINLCF